jgi:hypothetical protein
MSRAYEALLRNQLARLNRWIAESESLTSRPTDEATLQSVEADLARWRETRERCKAVFNRTKLLNRFVSWTLVTFWISFALLCLLLGFLSNNETLFAILGLTCGVLVIVSGAGHLVAITVRDSVAHGRRPWRFSLRSLLVVMTILAIGLGVWFWAIRY